VPRPADLRVVKDRALRSLTRIQSRYDSCRATTTNHLFVRWVGSMSAVDAHAVWERYAEQRLVVALAHHPDAFILNHGVRGLTRIPVGLAAVLVRGGGRYLDFRSCADLLGLGDRLLGKAQNPFRRLSATQRSYLDTLSAIRNAVVHQSDAAVASYKRLLTSVYGMKARPDPDEFLSALDQRATSPLRRQPRLSGLVSVLRAAITVT
jgi:hypothetical protein